MSDFGLDEYDYIRSSLAMALMEDMSTLELFVILDHAETTEDFIISVDAQIDLMDIVREHYGY
jgi:hypothetical protein